MTLRHCFIATAAVLLYGLSVPAHALCLGCTLAVIKKNDLRFGSLVVLYGGPVTLDPQGNRSGGGVWTPSSMQNSAGPATFVVSCSFSYFLGASLGGFSYRVSLGNTPEFFDVSTPSANMSISSFVLSPSAASNEHHVADCRGYTKEFTVGATLTVNESQAPGIYTSAPKIELVASPNYIF